MSNANSTKSNQVLNKKKSYIMAIDQGTTSSRTLLVDHEGRITAEAQKSFQQIFPQPGWVEHNPEDIWTTVKQTMEECLLKSGIAATDIAAIGITNQRETTIAWDKSSHKAIYNAIVWQCRRTTDFCNKVLKPYQKLVTKKTGLVIDPYFSGSKINWILRHIPQAKILAKKNQLAVGTVDSFLIWRLSNGNDHKTDVSNASRTQLMNIHTGKWDPELLSLFQIPANILPEITASSGTISQTCGLGFLPDGIPIAGVAGDQQAALFGQQGIKAGDIKVTFGTGSFLLLNTDTKPISSKHKLLTTIAWQLPNQKIKYALEGSVFVCGAAVQWLRDGLEFFDSSAEIQKLAESVPDSGGVEFIPALTGLGAPYWDPQARGIITGLERRTTKAHIARATLEAMALQNVDVIRAMEKDLGKKIKNIRVDGGAVKNDLLLQIQADYLGCKVQRPANVESTALGAAYLAGLGVGFWKNIKELQQIWKLDKEFKSALSNKKQIQRHEHWMQALKKCRLHA